MILKTSRGGRNYFAKHRLKDYSIWMATDRDRFFYLSRDLFCVAGFDGKFVELNPSWERILGWSAEELKAKPWLHFVHPQDRKATEMEGEKLERGELIFQFINRYICKNGTLRWLSWTSFPDSEEGKIFAVARDVTNRLRAEEQTRILAKFPHENPNPVLRINLEGKVYYSNPASDRLFSPYRHESGNLPDFFLTRVAESLAKSNSFEIGIGTKIYSFFIYPVSDSDSIYLYGLDVTSQKYYQEQLKLSASVFENAVEGITITDAAGTIQLVNKAFTDITGYSEEEAVGKNPRILKSDRHDPDFYSRMWKSLEEHGRWAGEIWNRRKSGDAYPEWISINAVKDYTGNISHYIAIFYDITEKKMQEEQLKYQAYHDALTGLPNRQLFKDRLNMVIASGSRRDIKAALLLLDLDDFKNINDTFGHQTGDRLLIEASVRLQGLVRKTDTVARIGGDEFIILLTEIDESEGSIEFARKLLATFNAPFELNNNIIYATLSIGITIFPDDADDPDDLIRNADMALYRAKQSGKNMYYPYTSSLMEAAVRRFTLESQMRRAVDREEFEVYYQPKLNIKENNISGAEALIRWKRQDGTSVAPGVFIPLAESNGLIYPIGEWVMRRACTDALEWIKEGYDLSLAVNLSGKQFYWEEIIEDIEAVLAETGFPPANLNLEITENAVITDTERAITIMKELSRKGIQFSLDDFGTGYSSLSYLKKFPLSVIKVDKTFIEGIPDDPDDVSISRAVIALGKSLNLIIVAEGVETEDQQNFLEEQGCHEVQGFFIGKPMNSNDFTRFLRSGRYSVGGRDEKRTQV